MVPVVAVHHDVAHSVHGLAAFGLDARARVSSAVPRRHQDRVGRACGNGRVQHLDPSTGFGCAATGRRHRRRHGTIVVAGWPLHRVSVGREAEEVDHAGGPVLTIASTGTTLGITWNAANVIVFAPDNRTALYRVSADGGMPEAITTLDASRRENSHRWPVFLPDGNHYLFTARSDVKENTAIYVGSLDSKTTTRLLTAQSNVAYAQPGYLLFAREGTLMAQRFDAGTLTLSGDAVPVVAGVDHIPASAQAMFAVSLDGSALAYHGAQSRNSTLTWFDRDGHSQGSIRPEKDFTTDLQISPDGKQALIVIPDPDSGNRDVWLLDLGAGGLTRLTTHPANDWQATWDPDSRHVVFASDRRGKSDIYRAATGGGEDALLLEMPRNIFAKDWSRDARFLLFAMDNPPGGTDVWVAPRTGDAKPYPLVASSFIENQSAFSPDGRWVSDESNEPGTLEVYVASFGGGGKQQVSRGAAIPRDGAATVRRCSTSMRPIR